MKQLHYVFKLLLRDKGGNLIKVISLGLGLAMSILLFSRVVYEQSFDTCFKEYDRIYQFWEIFTIGGERRGPFETNMGPTAGALLTNFPEEVEAATSTFRGWSDPFYRGDKRFTDLNILIADSLFFQTMGIEVLRGDAVSELQQVDVAFLSASTAKRIFGEEDPIGQHISYNQRYDLTVRGIFADVPDNTTVHPAVVVSFPTMWSRKLGNYSWRGGDSYHSYARLRPGVDVERLNQRYDELVHTKYLSKLPEGTNWLTYVAPLRDTYRNYPEVKRMRTTLSIMGFAILFIAALNYALIAIASLSRRAKMIGVHKCSGASSARIFGMFLLETAILISLALLFMRVLLYDFQDFVEETASTSLENLFAWERMWVPALTVGLLFLIGGVIPGRLFAQIPVSQVFRRYTEGKKGWKRPLLCVQFAGVAFISGLMVMVAAQYHYVMNKDMGFSTERIAINSWLKFFSQPNEADNLRVFFRNLPYVEEVTGSLNDPFDGYSGAVVEDGSQSNMHTKYDRLSENYFALMGMTLLEGRPMREPDEAVVNETFVEKKRWGNEAIGKVFEADGETFKVVGVMKDFVVGGFYEPPYPFVAITYGPNIIGPTLSVKLKEPFAENLAKLNQEMQTAYPDLYINFQSLEAKKEKFYKSVRIFRNAATVASIVMFFVMLMGLIGYTADEVQRRSKEIAIRKVNGAEAMDILRLLTRDVLVVALPSVLVGVGIAAYVNALWVDSFTEKVSVSWAAYGLVAIVNLAMIVGCVLWKSWHIANENPTVSLKNE